VIQKILKFGTIAGLLVGLPLFGVTVAYAGSPSSPLGYVFGYTTMLLALSMVFVAIKQHRDRDLGGVIGFWRALGLGVGISAVAGVFYVLSWEAALAVTHMDFAGDYARQVIEHKRARGVSGEALAHAIADMERFKADYARPLYRLSMSFTEIFPVGILVSLVSAGLLRNSRFLPARRG
jgi:hypothetical protein